MRDGKKKLFRFVQKQSQRAVLTVQRDSAVTVSCYLSHIYKHGCVDRP